MSFIQVCAVVLTVYCSRFVDVPHLSSRRCSLHSRECDSPALWRSFCDRTGKLNETVDDSMESSNPYKLHYYKIPCVPTDFASITAALSRCPAGGTITLLPGVYEERLEIRRSIHIRAAFPEKGAAVAWYKGVNEPCIAVVEDDIRNVSVAARLSNVQLLHSTEGSDIWGGNCAVLVEGRKSRLSITSCCIQSESGRGLVAVNGSFLEVKSTVIHDCAATGLYLGDNDSTANVSGCNLIRNGGGSRRPLRSDADDSDEDDADRVPAGHSGMYVEAGRAFVEDCLVAGNSLTGLSIVRGGGVIISGCDVTENGSDPILVEDASELEASVQNRRPMGVQEGPIRNNYSSRADEISSLQNVIHSLIEFGGTVRATQFHHVVTSKLMSTEAHESCYRRLRMFGEKAQFHD